MEFAQQYLFPRFKFLDQGWMEHDPGKKKSFSAFVQRKLKIRPMTQFADEWDNIIAPAIVKKYTDMRCNVNNAVRRTFIGEYRDICVLFSFTGAIDNVSVVSEPSPVILSMFKFDPETAAPEDIDELETVISDFRRKLDKPETANDLTMILGEEFPTLESQIQSLENWCK